MALTKVDRPNFTTPSNGNNAPRSLQETEHLPLHLPTDRWVRVQWQKVGIMVEKAKGVLPQWAAPVLLGAALTTGSFLYFDIRSTQREQLDAIRGLRDDLIILKTQKEATDKQRETEEKESREERDMNRLWRENIDKEITRLELRTGNR